VFIHDGRRVILVDVGRFVKSGVVVVVLCCVQHMSCYRIDQFGYRIVSYRRRHLMPCSLVFVFVFLRSFLPSFLPCWCWLVGWLVGGAGELRPSSRFAFRFRSSAAFRSVPFVRRRASCRVSCACRVVVAVVCPRVVSSRRRLVDGFRRLLWSLSLSVRYYSAPHRRSL